VVERAEEGLLNSTSDANKKSVSAWWVVALVLTVALAASRAFPSDLAPVRIVSLRYPRFAHVTGIQGKVELIATVSNNGEVKSVRDAGRSNVFSDAAKENLAKWRFSGCQSASAPCNITVTYVFTLTGDPCADRDCQTDFEVDLPDKVEVSSRPLPPMIN
jgi:TonB family protein